MRNAQSSFRKFFGGPEGYSLIELLVSVAILVILMSLIFSFLASNQKQYVSQQVLAATNQGGRSAFEIMSQELNQAGYSPPFTNYRLLSSAATASGSSVVNLSLSLPSGVSTSPVTKRVFYGTRLLIGNTCTTAGSPPVTICDQEEVTVNYDTGFVNGTTAIGTSTIPVVLANNHAAGESVYSRNYPYPQGIIYDNRTTYSTSATGGTVVTGAPLGVADNRLRFFGDLMDSGDLYYGEYNLRCPNGVDSSGNPVYIRACTPGCTTGPFTLTRFVTRLTNRSGVAYIPANNASVTDGAIESPLVDGIVGTCASPVPGTVSTTGWPVATVLDETAPGGSTTVYAAVNYTPIFTGPESSGVYVTPLLNPSGIPVIWFKAKTYGAYDMSTTPPNPYFQTFVVDVEIALTIQKTMPGAQGGATYTQRLQTRIVPRNILDALKLAGNGGATALPAIPIDPSHNCDTSVPPKCPSLPLGTLR